MGWQLDCDPIGCAGSVAPGTAGAGMGCGSGGRAVKENDGPPRKRVH
jgi:hypothetical protein